MTNASTRKSSAAAKSPLTLARCWAWSARLDDSQQVLSDCIFIPVALTYLAYALFGISPFGEESVLCLDLNGQYVYSF